MPRSSPAYRRETRRNLAVVTLRDAHTGKRRHYYLGRYDSPESWERYYDLLARWAAAGHRLPDAADDEPPARTRGPSCNRIAASYLDHAEARYVKPDGSPTSTFDNIRAAISPLRAVHGRTAAAEFGRAS